MIFLIISFLLSTIFICGMEKTPAIPSAEVLYLQVTKLLAGKDLETTLENYQITLNILFAHAEWVKVFKKIVPIIDDLETVQAYRTQKGNDGVFRFVRQFTYYSDKASGYFPMEAGGFLHILTNKKLNIYTDPYGISYNITTPQGMAIFLSIENAFTKSLHKSLEHYLEIANKLLSTTNEEEVKVLAGILKSTILSIIFYNCVFHAPHLEHILTDYQNIISVYALISPLLPYIEAIHTKLTPLHSCWKATSGHNNDSLFVTKELKELNGTIKQVLQDFSSFEPIYENLYKRLYEELGKKISTSRKNRITLMSFKKILEQLLKPEANISEALSQTITYTLPTLASKKVLIQTTLPEKKTPEKIEKKPKKRKRKKKKNQPTSQAKKPISPEAQESSTLVQTLEQVSLQKKTSPPTPTEQVPQLVNTLNLELSYDERVLQWLDSEYQKTHPVGVLYHTAPLILEKYILANNITTTRPHATRRNQVDRSYQSAGKIIYSDKKQETVIFTLTVDPENICYHVGIDHLAVDTMLGDYFTQSHWTITFPSTNSPVKKEKPTPQQLGSLSYIIEKEDEFHVRIKDLTNNVTLILYKKLSF